MQDSTFRSDLSIAISVFVDLWTVVRRTWEFLTNPIGNSNFTPIGILAGILILVLTVFLSRPIGHILEKRIAKRSYIDPGLRYTIARLASYLLIVIGIVAALQIVGVNMTSIAVLFTALSVGIGFGLAVHRRRHCFRFYSSLRAASPHW